MIKKEYIKTWCIKDYYNYKIYNVIAGTDSWLMAEPITPGTVTRTAEDEKILRIMLENDCTNAIKFQQKVR